MSFRPTPVPLDAHPAVRRLFTEMNAQQCTDHMMAERSGVAAYSLSDWRHRTKPNVANLSACLAVLGLELCVREMRE